MTIHSFGCSFIYGTDLDPPTKWPRPSLQTWPALIAQRMNREYRCHAWPGSGNLQILDNILNTEFAPTDVAVVCWSFIDRYDMRDYPFEWQTITPGQDTPQTKFYYQHLHTQYRDQLHSLTQINCAVTALQHRRVPFVMTTVDPLVFDLVWNIESGTRYLVDQVQSSFFTFHDDDFLTWSRRCAFEISPDNHPLHAAHMAAADYVVDRWQYILKTPR